MTRSHRVLLAFLAAVMDWLGDRSAHQKGWGWQLPALQEVSRSHFVFFSLQDDILGKVVAPLCAQFLDFAAVPALSAPSSRVLGRRQRGAARRKPSTTGRHQLLHEMVTPVLSWMLTAWVRLRPCIHQSQAEWPLLLGKKVPISGTS